MTQYDATFAAAGRVSAADRSTMILGEVLAQRGAGAVPHRRDREVRARDLLLQRRARGAVPGEERQLVPSPQDVATYDLKPEMSARRRRRRRGARRIESEAYALHPGELRQPRHGRPHRRAARGDHGDRGGRRVHRADRRQPRARTTRAVVHHRRPRQLRDDERSETGQPHTAHTTNPVPFIVADERYKGRKLQAGGRCATSRRRCSRSWACRNRPKWKATRSSDLSSLIFLISL